MTRTFGALLLFAAPQLAPAAPVPASDAKSAVALYFHKIERGIGVETASLLAPPAKDVIAELDKYMAAGTEAQQSRAVGLVSVVGRLSSDEEVRALAVRTLLAYAAAEGKPDVRYALEQLLRFTKADFPPKADATITKLVRGHGPHNEALLLAGLLDVRAVVDDLKPMAKTEAGQNPFFNNAWSANLALARLGDAAAVKHCIAAIAAEPDIAQRFRHLHELAYIRQDAATKELVRYLMSDERLPGVEPRDPGVKLALGALQALVECIDGFPIKKDKYGEYTDEQIIAAREWAKERKAFKLKP